MPSEHSLSGTGWTVSDFGGEPTADEFDVPCDNCGTTTTADKMDRWYVNMDLNTYEQTALCPDCKPDDK